MNRHDDAPDGATYWKVRRPGDVVAQMGRSTIRAASHEVVTSGRGVERTYMYGRGVRGWQLARVDTFGNVTQPFAEVSHDMAEWLNHTAWPDNWPERR